MPYSLVKSFEILPVIIIKRSNQANNHETLYAFVVLSFSQLCGEERKKQILMCQSFSAFIMSFYLPNN